MLWAVLRTGFLLWGSSLPPVPSFCPSFLPDFILRYRGSRVQDLANRLGSGNTKVEAGFPDLDTDVRSNYLANSTISGIDSADVILLIGTNPRAEAPVFNARFVCHPLTVEYTIVDSASLNLYTCFAECVAS